MQEGASWQVVLRALHAVEAIEQQGSTAACGEVAVHFQVSSHHKALADSRILLRVRPAPCRGECRALFRIIVNARAAETDSRGVRLWPVHADGPQPCQEGG